MPVLTSTAMARSAGTCVHCDSAPEVILSAAASSPRRPRFSFSHVVRCSMTGIISTTNFFRQAFF